MISIKDFAKGQGCSETIVYRHIRNNKKELGSNVQKLHGKTWLTDEGAELIRSLMKQQPIVISDTNEEIKKLQEENRQLLQSLNLAKDKIILLQEQNVALTLENAKIELLEADNNKAREEAESYKETSQKLSKELTEEKERRIGFKEYWRRRKS